MHPIIKVMLVGGKADGLLVSVADDAAEVGILHWRHRMVAHAGLIEQLLADKQIPLIDRAAVHRQRR